MHRQDIIVKTWPFLLISVMYIITAMVLGKLFGEDGFHLILNKYHHPIADGFFSFYTKTGEWFFGAALFLWLIWKSNFRMILIFITSAFLQAVTVQSLKRLLFVDHLRPAHYFQEKGIELHLIEGIKQGITYTFPSGHAATGFFIFMFLAILIKNRIYQAVLAIFAVLTAFSRMYLSQHFVLDTAAGAFIGISIVIFAYYFWYWIQLPFLNDKLIKK
ncbi:MAG: phosphatase PAP2 family protein [Flavobacteriaceae bacterium]|nr:phosphatase PAP2 family protein [Flavobacteriaceae bacterium]